MNGNNGVGMPPQGQPGQIPLSPQGQPMYPQGMQQPQFAPQAPSQPAQYGPPQVPQGVQQQINRLSLGGDEILDGASVPPELRGRKVSEVMRIYAALADDFVERKRHVQGGQGNQTTNPNQQVQQQQQARNPQNQNQRQGQGQQPAARWDGWQDPAQEELRNVVQQVVQDAIQPFANQNLVQGARTAREQAQQRIPDFRDLEADILEAVKGSSAEALASPEYWEHAADLARGRKMRNTMGQQQPQMQQAEIPQWLRAQDPSPIAAPAPQLNQNFPRSVAATQIPQPQMPQQQQGFAQPQNPWGPPRPQTHQFFTEAPTAPSVYQNSYAGALTPAQQKIADLAGVPHDQYQAMLTLQRQGG